MVLYVAQLIRPTNSPLEHRNSYLFLKAFRFFFFPAGFYGGFRGDVLRTVHIVNHHEKNEENHQKLGHV